MKTVYLLPTFLFLFVSFLGFSKQIDTDVASSIATKFIQQKQGVNKRSGITLKLHYTSSQEASVSNQKRNTVKNNYYIFNFSDNKGFVIIAADDKVNPILGYSVEKAFDIAKYLDNCGNDVVISLVSPYREMREQLKSECKVQEIYCHTKKIRGREDFFALDYEKPIEFFINLDTSYSVDDTFKNLIKHIV